MLMVPQGEFWLEDVSVLSNPEKVRFTATLAGPEGADVWVRAWISDDRRTLSETASPRAVAGDTIVLEVASPPSTSGCSAYLRIESQPLITEHILRHRLD